MRRVTIGAAIAAVVNVGVLAGGALPAFALVSTLSVTAMPNPSVHGQAVTICANVTPTATGTVEFTAPGASTTTVAFDATGLACMTTSQLMSGTVIASYGGDGTYDPAAATTTVTVLPANTTTAVTATPDPSVSGEAVQLCAAVTVDAPGAGTPTGTVTFTGAGGFAETVTVDGSGQACVTSATLAAGTVTATYAGDSDFGASTGTATVTRNKADTTTTLTVQPDPSTHGQSVTLCATVVANPPGSGTPTGSVVFTGPGGLMETAAVDASGQACVTSTTLATGSVAATYTGDTAFSASTASASATVNPAATTTTVSADVNPSTAGQTVQVCATVAAAVAQSEGSAGRAAQGSADQAARSFAGRAAKHSGQHAAKHSANDVAKHSTHRAPRTENGTPPTGTVMFSGAGLSEIVALSAGQACVTTATLVTGTVTAIYNGDTDFASSTGTLAVTVNPASVTPSAPSRPLNVAAVAGASAVTVSWDPPATGGPVTGYIVTAAPGPATCTTTGATTCVLGAVAGTSYTYTVVAHSAAGDSEASQPSAAVAPVAPTPPATPPSTNLTLTTSEGEISTAEPGQSIVFVGNGFAPFSTVLVTIYSTPLELGRATADAAGNFQVPITLPQRLATGAHTVVAQGAATDGSLRSMALAVTVTAGAATNGGSLPTTGAPIGLLVLTGTALAATGAGLILVAEARRRRLAA